MASNVMEEDSDSSLSSTHSTDDEALIARMTKPVGLNRYFKPAAKADKEPTPEPPKRAPSPPHEYTLADNDAIAFIVMFRSRFNDAFPKSLPHYGPQDIERGVSSEEPDEYVERLLCALLGLVLNRKKDVEKGHYGRALEDAISSNKHQWPLAWNGQNPLPGERTFNSMTAEERLNLLKALVLWSLNSSEAVQTILKESYKQTRRDDDKNQPKSVQPWFSDPYRRKYYLIEGIEDTHFRVYRENDGKTKKTNTWFSVAGTIEEVTALADKFEQEGTTQARLVHDRIKIAVPRFEAGEEKRRRRDYRMARKAAFARPEPGFSLYEGRTRGKRMRYTYSDGEEEDSDIQPGKRSTRNSGYASPFEHGPTVTASGRQVKSRVGGMYGETMLLDQRKDMERNGRRSGSTHSFDDVDISTGRPTVVSGQIPSRGRYADGLESESESDAAQSSGKEWSGNEEESDEEEPDFAEDDERDDNADGLLPAVEDDENTQESLVVKLSYRPSLNSVTNGVSSSIPQSASLNGTEMKSLHIADWGGGKQGNGVQPLSSSIDGEVKANGVANQSMDMNHTTVSLPPSAPQQQQQQQQQQQRAPAQAMDLS